MREVQPEVYLVSRPNLDWDGVRDYLTEVVGSDTAQQVETRLLQGSDAEALVEIGGRLCYRSWAPGANPNVTKIREDSKEYLGNILSSGHGSVIEHANFSFILRNVSRVLTHELVRHRAGVAVSQESMRFVRLTEIPFWFPQWALEDQELMDQAYAALDYLEQFQTWMSAHFELDSEGVSFQEKKHKTSFMRRFAPHGVATDIMMTLNVRSLRHIIYMRTSLGAEEEIRLVMDQIAELALEEIPNLMQDYSRDENQEWIPEFLKV